MKRVALKIEHKYKNRSVATHLIEGDSGGVASLGSARRARVRLVGDEVAGLHAAVSFEDGQWKLMDLGSQSGTWVNNQNIIETSIVDATVIQIGPHQLKATPLSFERELFTLTDQPTEGKYLAQQVVVFRRGRLHQSMLYPVGQSWDSGLSGVGVLAAVETHDWTEVSSEEWTVRRRLVRTEVLPNGSERSEENDWRRGAPVMGVLALLTLILGVLVMMPKSPKDDLKTLTPEMRNQYTRLIFDGQKVRKQRAVAEKMRKNIQGQSQTGVAKNTPGGDTGSKNPGGSKASPGAKVVMNLKNAGLGAMIGKVAARAGQNARLIEAAGRSADSGPSGRALSLGGGSSMDKLGGGGGGTGQAMKVGGLGTLGYQGSGALSLGNVGNAEVGVIEEETEVDGGLDREAIARVIRSQLGQIRYCYERQLSASPDLYGKIMVKFTIGAAGSVVAQAIGTTSLNNAMVEGCILRRVAGWQFPTPKGGTNVMVTYPFLFKSTK
jgi:FHA domain